MLHARSVSGEVISLPLETVTRFAGGLKGRVLRREDDGYEGARRLWNAMIDRKPALIAQCTGADDVVRCIRFAREHDLLVSVRSGGHNVSGNAVADDALMIDMSPTKDIRVDGNRAIARAEAGVLWAELDRETHACGLATPGGVVATTGIAGLTLGGGQGWLTGKHGLTIDNLLSAEVVLVDGERVHASESTNADLFWGLRGAGANLGIVTSFEYRLHPVRTVVGGMVAYPIDSATDHLRFYRDFAAAQPDELTTYALLLTTPQGIAVALTCCYVGDSEAGFEAVAPLRERGAPIFDTIAAISYLDMQAIITAANPYGRFAYWKSGLTSRLSDALIDALIEHARRVPSPLTAIAIADCHGAYSRVSPSATAYFHRDQQFDVVILSSWTDRVDSQRNIDWTRDCHAAIEPHLAWGIYVNDLGQEDSNRVRRAYGGNLDRLIALKRRYDPDNFLRLNQNIPT